MLKINENSNRGAHQKELRKTKQTSRKKREAKLNDIIMNYSRPITQYEEEEAPTIIL